MQDQYIRRFKLSSLVAPHPALRLKGSKHLIAPVWLKALVWKPVDGQPFRGAPSNPEWSYLGDVGESISQ
jgi:hypothetical protein